MAFGAAVSLCINRFFAFFTISSYLLNVNHSIVLATLNDEEMWPTKKTKKRDHSEYQVIDEEDDPIVTDRSTLPRLAFNSFPSPANATAAGTSAYPPIPIKPNNTNISSAADVGLRPDLFGGPPELHDADVNRSQLVASSASTRRWDHIENLDQFFTRVYEYHQRGGFACVAFAEALALIQFIFLVSFAAFLSQCVDYNVLFRNVQLSPNVTKRTVNVRGLSLFSKFFMSFFRMLSYRIAAVNCIISSLSRSSLQRYFGRFDYCECFINYCNISRYEISIKRHLKLLLMILRI